MRRYPWLQEMYPGPGGAHTKYLTPFESSINPRALRYWARPKEPAMLPLKMEEANRLMVG